MGKSDNGREAEQIAMAFERLRVGPLASPAVRYVGDQRGLGYDIRSQEGPTDLAPRYIEVKAMTADRRFFITERERQNLTALGDRAWLYLVDLNQQRVVRTIQNPLRVLEGPGTPLIYKNKI